MIEVGGATTINHPHTPFHHQSKQRTCGQNKDQLIIKTNHQAS